MSERRKRGGLQAYHQWQSANLDEARAEMGRRSTIAQRKLDTLHRIEQEIAESQRFARERTESQGGLSVESLQRFAVFSAYQRTELSAAHLARATADRAVDEARSEVISTHQRLSAVERLLKRRSDSATRLNQQAQQKQLDEGALTRGPHVSVNDRGQE